MIVDSAQRRYDQHSQLIVDGAQHRYDQHSQVIVEHIGELVVLLTAGGMKYSLRLKIGTISIVHLLTCFLFVLFIRTKYFERWEE